MKTLHFFLCRVAPVPQRLREAFPALRVLKPDAWLASSQGLQAAQCLIWLSSADPHWQADLAQVRQDLTGARVVLLSAAPEPMEGLNAFNQGARGYTHAYAVPALLQEVALVVAHDGLWVGPDLLQRLVGSTSEALVGRRQSVAEVSRVSPDKAWASLSAREAQVARAVSAGRSNKEVAAQLYISERTVKAHLGAVFEKLGVRDRLQLVLRLAESKAALPSFTSEPLV